jgi:hypothetical protein
LAHATLPIFRLGAPGGRPEHLGAVNSPLPGERPEDVRIFVKRRIQGMGAGSQFIVLQMSSARHGMSLLCVVRPTNSGASAIAVEK